MAIMAFATLQKKPASPGKQKSGSQKKSPCEYPGRSRQGPGMARTVPLGDLSKQVEFSNFDIARSYVKPEHEQFVEVGMQKNQDTLAGLGLKVLAIEGATSTTGSSEYNEELSRKRASCVFQMLSERVPLLMPDTPLILQAGEAPARNRLKVEGLDPTKEVEAGQDRKVTVLLGLPGPTPGPAPGPTPLPPDPTEMDCVFKQFDQHCAGFVTYKKWGEFLACDRLNERVCATLRATKDMFPENVQKSIDKCCTDPDPAPSGDQIEQQIEDCVVSEAERVYGEAGHDIDPEDLRTKYRDWRDNRSADQAGTDCSDLYEPK